MGQLAQIAVTEVLETEQCYKCSIWFAMPRDFMRRKREDGGSFVCPNGHSQAYLETELMKAREALAAEEARHRSTLSRLNETQAEREKQDRKLKRVNRGVCPECNRTFQNLARHMCTKHKP